MTEINLSGNLNNESSISGSLDSVLNLVGSAISISEISGGDISIDKTQIIEGEILSTQALEGNIGTTQVVSADIMYNTLKPIVDTELSSTSINPIANKTVYEALQNFTPNTDNINISVEVGTVETVEFEDGASVTNSGSGTNAILDFKIPRGQDGKTPYIGSNGNWFIGENDTGFPATAEGLSADLSQILSLFDNGKFAHSITIGEHVYDGTEDIIIDIYNGELSNEEIVSLLNAFQDESLIMTTNNNANTMTINNNANTMTINNNANTMTMNSVVNTMTMSME